MRLLHGLALASAMVIALPATSLPAAADSWKDESGHGRHGRHHHGHYHGGGKQVFYDGPCRVERKWKGNGGYKEETRCPGYAYGPAYYTYPAYHYPPVVYGYPVPRGPSISITIPLD